MAATGRRAGALPGPELELAPGALRDFEIDAEEIPLVVDHAQGPAASQRNFAAGAAAAAASSNQRSPLLFVTLIASLGG